MPQLALLAALAMALADGPQAAAPPSPADLVAALEQVMGDAIEQAAPSVVAIARERIGKGDETTAVRGLNKSQPLLIPRAIGDPIPQNFAEQDLHDPVSSDFGSGVVIGNGGEILTEYHVVKGATRLLVKAAGSLMFDAEIIAADPRSDLAVIVPRSARGSPAPALKPIRLGDATKLRKGAFLVALGNAFNSGRDGSASASWGILANVARRVELSPEEENSNQKQLRHYPTLLQLDAKLNLGMSGGAVVNMKGELVGLTTSAASPEGFDAQAGYAIPIDALARSAIERLKQGKEVEYGFMGVSLNPEVANRVSIRQIRPGTPADQGGLHDGDIITAVGDQPVTDSDSLILAVNAAPVGKPIRLRIEREDRDDNQQPRSQVLEKTLVLSKLPVEGEVIATNRPAPWRGMRVDFTSALRMGTLSDAILDAMTKGGVAIIEVIPGSAAEHAGLKRGQVITKVDHNPVHTPDEFTYAIEGHKGPVKLTTDLGEVTVK